MYFNNVLVYISIIYKTNVPLENKEKTLYRFIATHNFVKQVFYLNIRIFVFIFILLFSLYYNHIIDISSDKTNDVFVCIKN